MDRMLLADKDDALKTGAILAARKRHEERKRVMDRLMRLYENGCDTGDGDKPNANYYAYISDTQCGFFLGKPVSYSAAPELSRGLELLQDALDRNGEREHNQRVLRDASVMGFGAEALFLSEQGEVRLTALDSREITAAYPESGGDEPAAVYRFYTACDYSRALPKPENRLDIYTDTEIVRFVERAGGYERQSAALHGFSGVPIVIFANNRDERGDFERVIPLIKSYNLAQSLTESDMRGFTNALLMLTGVDGTDTRELEEISRKGAALMPEGGSARWLTKEVNDSFAEVYKTRLRRDIHTLSLTPDISDENFAQSQSGVAISYKLWGAEQAAATKEDGFRRALRRRMRLICPLVVPFAFDLCGVNISFTRNIPQNTAEIAETMNALSGFLSKRTLISMLPFVDDPAYEEKMREEENNGGK